MTVEEHQREQARIDALVQQQTAAAEVQRREVARSHVLAELAASGTIKY